MIVEDVVARDVADGAIAQLALDVECHVGVHLALGLPFGGSFALAFARRAKLRLLLCLALLGGEIPNGEIVERNLVPRPLPELHEVLDDPTVSAEKCIP